MIDRNNLTEPEIAMLVLLCELGETYWIEFVTRYEEFTDNDFPEDTFEKIKQEVNG